ncbi:hypothetical protein BAE44_0012301, partial [Dichanthelium oligosanthes]
ASTRYNPNAKATTKLLPELRSKRAETSKYQQRRERSIAGTPTKMRLKVAIHEQMNASVSDRMNASKA